MKFSKIITICALLLSLGAIGLGGLAYHNAKQVPSNIGATGTKFVGILPTYLSGAGVSSSVTSIGVTSLTIKQTGQVLSMSDFGDMGYATLEPGSSARQEFISFTGITQNTNGTAVLTGVTRGLSPVYPYTASTTVRFAHGGGTTVIISNSPPFYDTFANKANDGTITGTYTFTSTAQPVYDVHPTFSNGLALVDKTYVDGVTAAGVASSSETNFGGVWLGTALQQASSTNGGTNKPYVMQTRYATDTPQSGCAVGYTTTAGAGCSVIAQLTGKIRQTFLNLSEAWTFTGAVTTNSTVTNNATTTSNGRAYGYGDFMDALASTTITGNTTPQPVFISTTTNAVLLSDANDNNNAQFLGFAVSNAVNGGTTTIIVSGVVGGFTGLTRGSQYYVQDAIGTIGTTVGTYEILVGQAISSTQLLITQNNSGTWQYLGSGSCTWGTGATGGNCDVAGPPTTRFASYTGTQSVNAACGSVTSYTSGTLMKKGNVTVYNQTAGACGGSAIGLIVTATLTSTSSIHFVYDPNVTAITGLGAGTSPTAYFYR